MTNFNLFNIFYCFLIVAMPIFLQRTAYQSINERKFKKYKIKRLGFLFKGMEGESASTHGVILPMLVIQIQGYILGVLTLSFMIINEIFNFIEEAIVTVIVIIICFIHALTLVSITIITGIISKKGQNKK